MENKKRLSRGEVLALRTRMDSEGKRLVFTNGCFDILHEGHRTYLAEAAKLGDFLVVGLNSDASVRQLKGPGRPVRDEAHRAHLVAELPFVGGVTVFEELHVWQFVEQLRPHVYVKGGDYMLETVEENLRRVLVENKIEARFVGLVPGVSTTKILAGMAPAERDRLKQPGG
jgi:rfaE bifunctional protein nucleotidyltransferase chain/domain